MTRFWNTRVKWESSSCAFVFYSSFRLSSPELLSCPTTSLAQYLVTGFTPKLTNSSKSSLLKKIKVSYKLRFGCLILFQFLFDLNGDAVCFPYSNFNAKALGSFHLRNVKKNLINRTNSSRLWKRSRVEKLPASFRLHFPLRTLKNCNTFVYLTAFS